MNLEKLLDLSYLFNRFPPAGFSWPLRIVLLIIFVGSLVLAFYTHKKIGQKDLRKKLWKKIQVWSWTNGLVGLTLMYFREVRALYLSARGWLLIFILLMFVWLIFIIIFAKTKLPDKAEAEKKEQEFNKWLPKKK
ncbi:MAG: hypothetical protein A2406_03485 [Candidatus Komeilibacteria bacterium RIFOXYC1_FULL_37_11]|uniref:Uncharacterized protein n=1 Tax=Candidatus Komeilibacteria bacterium RIFOXYC1_FULL_37_11 TaxID=1798555 RepID=A0A1G2C033_9BACT|nr:MAG: hypothetical protein A2406_03485 [Candidatus Komeilibacteria bacterium RIFOXYC1_FULL_37_11]OGY95161.1 MAG: hypothetical protein A2611_00425 [Candidatus Komeilibacteria bacterium RIFOXYD1_FULL_37_29]OGY96356.1 MAG: hypothetical protein A2543_01820 [Candidatus Komeilibacteria bacterium RIFOXYD2_FULL_37_8]